MNDVHVSSRYYRIPLRVRIRAILPVLIVIIVTVSVLCGSVGVWVLSSHYEAKAFNEVTGKNVTTWQAMWIQLRVQESSSYDKENK